MHVERQCREFAHSVLSLSSESNLRGHSYSNSISLIFNHACNFTFAYNQTWCHSCFFVCSTTVKQRREKNKQAKCCKYDSEGIFMICKSQCSFRAVQRKKRIFLCVPGTVFQKTSVAYWDRCVVWLLHNRQPLIQCQIRSYEKRKKAQSWNICLGSPFFFIY